MVATKNFSIYFVLVVLQLPGSNYELQYLLRISNTAITW